MKRAVFAVVILALLVSAGLGFFAVFVLGSGCQPTKASQFVTNGLPEKTFGAVTEFSLPNASRWANGIMVQPDGSVWFGEQGVPGLGHFTPSTGELVEYTWPCYPAAKGGGPVSSIWGLASWQGKVWSADGDANRLIGLDPGDGSVTYINTTRAEFPYIPTVAPDGSLWFTSLTSNPARIGRLSTSLGLSVYDLPALKHKVPLQIEFVNSTFAYMAALDPADSTDSGIYTFNPATAGSTIAVTKIGGNFTLFYPQSVSAASGRVWVAQHLPSNIIGLDPIAEEWTTFPTSTIRYENSTLPYFVEANGTVVWFNEHYANKIAVLDSTNGRLTEYSESNPAPSNFDGVQNDLTFAIGRGRVWFTSTTGNYIGFVDTARHPGFAISVLGGNSLTVARGAAATLQFSVNGIYPTGLSVQFSDSERPTSKPFLVSISADKTSIPAGSGVQALNVTIRADSPLPPGKYTIGVTVTDGLVYQTAYVFLTVT